MYSELIERLRCLAKVYSICENENTQEYKLAVKAADAIEELQKQLREEKVDNVNLTGWLAEEHAKAEDFENRLNLWRQDKIRRWIPVTERLPENYELVLTCDERGNIHIFPHLRHFKYPFGIRPEDPRFFMPKWWMPLPEPPESGDKR